ncbi:SUMF1/EgtB/PvdO family nonheme iron enzyme [Nonlabens ponticola]|uniref:Sulfatase-modifying factor enzyme-like domain-containing protein n=1 Tax=Nonlabens ponticola TaxID=2496866 RepID=A0A3S9MXI3_9FLAO|nr:SUMF1/EgtB/PvdO family nonheme iron enzyme [Nonlabens ponticola]AZQ43965.1 hypothetical protein EJ995_06860 [Nonlabens ponticola]
MQTRFRYIFTVLLLLIITGCGSSNSGSQLGISKTASLSVPPGTIKVNDSLYIDRVPVTNLMYNEFLDNLENYWSMKKHDRMKNYPRYKLSADTVFQPWTGNTRLYMEATFQDPKAVVERNLQLGSYSSSPQYKYHPAVNVSKFQAELFCFWRTDLANAVFAMRSNNKSKRSKFPYKVTYRLPTASEMVDIENTVNARGEMVYYQDEIFSAPLGIYTFKSLQESGKLVIMELNEIGQDKVYNPLFNEPLQYYEPSELKTGFRCVCEVDNNQSTQ